jgi:hypothetical protein
MAPLQASAPATPEYIYAIGPVVPRIPSPGIEKELLQVMGRGDTAGLTDRQALHSVLSDRRNRYLARNICYVFTIEGLETYILQPRDPADFELLIEAIRPTPRATDLDVVVGIRGPLAPAEICNGLVAPMVLFDQIYSFDIDELIGALPRPQDIPPARFTPAAEELLTRIMQGADNAGATDEDRALNYLAVRYAHLYATAAEQFGRDAALTSITTQPSRLSGARRIVEVVFTFTHRTTDVASAWFVRVDVTDEFPFLLTKLSPYVAR